MKGSKCVYYAYKINKIKHSVWSWAAYEGHWGQRKPKVLVFTAVSSRSFTRDLLE